MIAQRIEEHIQVANKVLTLLTADIEQAAQKCKNALQIGNKLFFCGNGGSAADAQHLAAEFVGRFVRERLPLPALALTTDSSALTAIGNDYGFEAIFARQIAAFGEKGDVLIAISTSGNSPNVLKAVEAAHEKGVITIGFLGKNGGELAKIVHHPIIVPSEITAHIQEMHILIGHILCEYCDEIDNRQ